MDISIDQKWKQNAITVAGGNGQGEGLNQLNRPIGFYIDNKETIYIADSSNNRIVAWKKNATYGEIVAGGHDRLNRPRKVIMDEVNDSLIIADYGNSRVVRWPRRSDARRHTIIKHVSCVDLSMDKNGYLYVSDDKRDEVRRWKIGENEGVLVAGGNGCGLNLNQLNQPRSIHVDQDETLYISDHQNHRVMKWTKGAKEGIIVAGGQGQGASLKQLSYPEGIFVDKSGALYVSDEGNARVVRWTEDAEEGSIIVGGNNNGNKPNQFNRAVGLSFDDENSVYIADYNNHRIQKFIIDK